MPLVTHRGTTQTLADALFADDAPHEHLSVCVDGADNARDLFVFCLELLFAGLIRRTEGTDGETLDVARVTQDVLDLVVRRMKLIGVHATVAMTPTVVTGIVGTNLEVLLAMPGDLPLENYVFKYVDGMRGETYAVCFELHEPQFAPSLNCHRA